jgi:hypothetical protein
MILKYLFILGIFALLALPPFFWRRLAYENQAEAFRQRAKQREREQALYILGLSDNASNDDIRTAHKVLMKKAHPDLGGSKDWAAKVNAAKDALLK